MFIRFILPFKQVLPPGYPSQTENTLTRAATLRRYNRHGRYQMMYTGGGSSVVVTVTVYLN